MKFLPVCKDTVSINERMSVFLRFIVNVSVLSV